MAVGGEDGPRLLEGCPRDMDPDLAQVVDGQRVVELG